MLLRISNRSALSFQTSMGVMLEKSKLADELMDVIGHLAGARSGGMAIGMVLVGVMMGATTGIVGATIVMLGVSRCQP